MIYNTGDGFVISSQHMWLPGVYESERAAKYAFRFRDDQLEELMDVANNREGGIGGTITFLDLQNKRKECKQKS